MSQEQKIAFDNSVKGNPREERNIPQSRETAFDDIVKSAALEETKMSEEQKSKVQQVTVERLQCSHGQLIQVVSVFPVQGSATPEDKLKALIDLDAQQGKLCA